MQQSSDYLTVKLHTTYYLLQTTFLGYAQCMKRLKKFLRHLFLPHHTNNHRAKILHHESMLVVVAILILGSIVVGTLRLTHPGVLGVSVNMSVNDLLLLTNIARQQNNLPVLQLNGELTAAAQAKAANMFSENYWAHNSPSGKTPWDFIKGAGYNYIYAGENLARGFSTAQDTMNAWMASPDHRANILSPNYQDVGFAIAQGNLTGDNGTVLVVEEFGSTSFARPPIVPVAQAATSQQTVTITPVAPTFTPSPIPTAIVTPSVTPIILGSQGFESLTRLQKAPFINTAFWARTLMVIMLGIFLLAFILDFIIIGKRQMVRIVGHNADHILFLLGILILAYCIGRGIVY